MPTRKGRRRTTNRTPRTRTPRTRTTARTGTRRTTRTNRRTEAKMPEFELKDLSIMQRQLKRKWFRADTAPLWFFIFFAGFALIHNLIFALIGAEEPIFFILSLLSLFAFFVALIYLIVLLIINAIKK